MTQPTLLFLPGLGADERLAAPQRAAFPTLQVPPWIAPHRGEALREYAARFALSLKPGPDLWIAGVSFGGFVALELAHLLRPRGVILVASSRSIGAVPGALRALSALTSLRLGPRAVPRPVLRSFLQLLLGPMPAATASDLLTQALAVDPAFIRWAIRAACRWPGSSDPPCRVLHIHGDADRLIRPKRVGPDVWVRGAGHAVNLTHHSQVNAAMLEFVR